MRCRAPRLGLCTARSQSNTRPGTSTRGHFRGRCAPERERATARNESAGTHRFAGPPCRAGCTPGRRCGLGCAATVHQGSYQEQQTWSYGFSHKEPFIESPPKSPLAAAAARKDQEPKSAPNAQFLQRGPASHRGQSGARPLLGLQNRLPTCTRRQCSASNANTGNESGFLGNHAGHTTKKAEPA